MTLYKVHFTAGSTELEPEVHPSPGMQRQVGDGSVPGDCSSVLESPVDWVGTRLLTQSLLPCANCVQQGGGLVPGDPRTRLCWELLRVPGLLSHHWYLSRSHRRAYACDQAPLSSCWSKARLILTIPPLPPWVASWCVSTVSWCEGAGLYSAFPWHSRALLDTSNRTLPYGSPTLVSASAPFLPVASGLQLSSHLFIWPSSVLVSLALIWLPLAQDLNASQSLIYLSSHMQTHMHTCEVRKYNCSYCTDGER